MRPRLYSARRASVSRTSRRTRNEGHWPGLEQSGPDECFAHATCREPLRIIGHVAGAEWTNLVGKAVVAAQSRHFLDEIDLAQNIAPPGRGHDTTDFIRFGARVESD